MSVRVEVRENVTRVISVAKQGLTGDITPALLALRDEVNETADQIFDEASGVLADIDLAGEQTLVAIEEAETAALAALNGLVDDAAESAAAAAASAASINPGTPDGVATLDEDGHLTETENVVKLSSPHVFPSTMREELEELGRWPLTRFIDPIYRADIKAGTSTYDVQSRLDTALDSGEFLYLDGHYKLGSQIMLPTGTDIKGSGPDTASIKAIDGTGFNMIVAVDVENIRLQDFEINGNKRSQANPTGAVAGSNLAFVNTINTFISGLRSTQAVGNAVFYNGRNDKIRIPLLYVEHANATIGDSNPSSGHGIAFSGESLLLPTGAGLFDEPTGWAIPTGWVLVAGAAEHTPGNTGALSRTIATMAGGRLEVIVNVANRTAGSVSVVLSDSDGGNPLTGRANTGLIYFYDMFVCGANTTKLSIVPTSDFDGDILDVGVIVFSYDIQIGEVYAFNCNGSGVNFSHAHEASFGVIHGVHDGKMDLSTLAAPGTPGKHISGYGVVRCTNGAQAITGGLVHCRGWSKAVMLSDARDIAISTVNSWDTNDYSVQVSNRYAPANVSFGHLNIIRPARGAAPGSSEGVALIGVEGVTIGSYNIVDDANTPVMEYGIRERYAHDKIPANNHIGSGRVVGATIAPLKLMTAQFAIESDMPNLADNPGFTYAPDGTSKTVNSSTNTFLCARYRAYRSGAGNGTFSRVSGFGKAPYALRLRRNTGDTSLVPIGLLTQFPSELVRSTWRNKFISVAFLARKGADFSSATGYLSLTMLYGTGTDEALNTGFPTGHSEVTVTVGSENPLLTTPSPFQFAFFVPGTTQEAAMRWLWTPTGTALSGDYFDIAELVIVVGSAAPPYAGKAPAREMTECLPYFERLGGDTADDHFGMGAAFSGTSATVTIGFSPKRKAPAVTIPGAPATAYETVLPGSTASPSAIVLAAATKREARLTLTGSYTSGDPLILKAKTTAGVIDVDATL